MSTTERSDERAPPSGVPDVGLRLQTNPGSGRSSDAIPSCAMTPRPPLASRGGVQVARRRLAPVRAIRGRGAGRHALPAARSHARGRVGQTAFERLYRAFIAARAALGLALVIALAVGGAFGLRPNLWAALISLAYAGVAMSMWALPRLRPPAAPAAMAQLRSPQWLATNRRRPVVLHCAARAGAGDESELRRTAWCCRC